MIVGHGYTLPGFFRPWQFQTGDETAVGVSFFTAEPQRPQRDAELSLMKNFLPSCFPYSNFSKPAMERELGR
jgi:hypothetical protein